MDFFMWVCASAVVVILRLSQALMKRLSSIFFVPPSMALVSTQFVPYRSGIRAIRSRIFHEPISEVELTLSRWKVSLVRFIMLAGVYWSLHTHFFGLRYEWKLSLLSEQTYRKLQSISDRFCGNAENVGKLYQFLASRFNYSSGSVRSQCWYVCVKKVRLLMDGWVGRGENSNQLYCSVNWLLLTKCL